MDPYAAAALGPPAGDDYSWLMPEEEPLALGPPDDPDYHEAPKPNRVDVLATADDLLVDHSLRIGQAKEYGQFLECTYPGYFKEDEDLIRDDLIETMPLLGEREAYEFRCGFLAMHEPYPRLQNRDAIDRDEAIAIEDLVVMDFQSEERQYAKQYGGDLRWDEAAHLLRGVVVGLDVLDPADTYSGLSMQLIDPFTVFPVWGGPAGLVEVYRVYEDTNTNIVGAYGGKPGSSDYQSIENKVKKGASKTKRGKRNYMQRDELRTVTECWNRDWLTVILDEEEELFSRKHGYRRLPFTITAGMFDQPASLSVGSQADRSEPEVGLSDWGEITISGRSLDLARQMRPYGWRHVQAHRIAEAVAGRRLSNFKWAIDPHKVLEFDPATEHKMAKEIDLLPGETTRIPLPNKLNLISPVIDANVMAGLASDLQANVGSDFLTQMRLGAVPPQTSGSAMGKMAALGGAAFVVATRALQNHKRARAEWRLDLRRDYGDAIRAGGGELGAFRVPGQSGAKPFHEVTPAMLRRAGCQVDIELHYWQPDVALTQELTTLRTPSVVTGRPLISDETARRKLKATPDIDREGDRIDDEALAALPPVQQRRHLARLDRQLDRALDAGDDESADDTMVSIAELEYLHEQAIASGQAAPPGGGAGPGAGMGIPTPPQAAAPPAPPAPAPPALPGMSLPELGIGVGTNGGRPQGGGVEAVTPVGAPRRGGL